MKKKKILIITGEFLPHTESVGGVIRVFSFLKTLKNYKKYVVCKKSKFRGYFGLKKYLINTSIIHINKFSNKQNNIFIKIIKYFFSNLLYLFAIDNSFFFLKLYKKKILKVLETEKINKVLISGPPFSIFYLVPFIRSKYPNIKIILDYRDGWGKRIKSNFYFLKYIQHKIEKKILLNCNCIILATKKIFEDIKTFDIKIKKLLIYNGYLKLQSPKKRKLKLDKQKINVGYFGLISDNKNSYRDINILIKPLERLYHKKFHFHFFGNSKLKRTTKYKKFFSFYKNTSYLITQNLMKQFDYLLILHTEKSTSSEVITGKFFEYLLSGKPIIIISNGKTEAGKIIKKHKVGYEIDYSEQNLLQSLNKLNKKFFQKRKLSIENYNRDFQNIKLERLIKNYE